MNRLNLLACMLLVTAVLPACTTTSTSKPADPKRAAIINAELGTRYIAQGELELAKLKLEKALSQDASLPAANAGYALLMSQLGKSKEAEKHFKVALKRDPYNSELLNNYGTFLCGQGRIDMAEQQFLEALKDPLYKTPEYAFTNAGSCSLKIPDYDKAEAYFGKALQNNPRFSDALYGMVELYDQRGNFRLASAYMEKFNRYGSHTPESLWLAIRLAKQANNKDAEASYSLLLKNQFPDSEQAAYLRSAKVP